MGLRSPVLLRGGPARRALPRPGRRVRVYLPDGEWRRFPGGDAFQGGRTHEFVLGLDELAVFARAAPRFRSGPAVPHTGALGVAPVVAEVWRAPLSDAPTVGCSHVLYKGCKT